MCQKTEYNPAELLNKIKKCAVFHGRASRLEYGLFLLFACCTVEIILVICCIIAEVWNCPATESLFFAACAMLTMSMLFIVPFLAITVRRLHDTGRSAAWLLLNLIPCLFTPVLVIMVMLPAERHGNKYGNCSQNRFANSPFIIPLAVIFCLLSGYINWQYINAKYPEAPTTPQQTTTGTEIDRTNKNAVMDSFLLAMLYQDFPTAARAILPEMKQEIEALEGKGALLRKMQENFDTVPSEMITFLRNTEANAGRVQRETMMNIFRSRIADNAVCIDGEWYLDFRTDTK